MTGNRKANVVLQARDRKLLAELGTMRLLDRELAKVVAGFGSNTRANTRLLLLTRAGLLNRFFVGTIAAGQKAIYTLSAKGAELSNADFGGIKRKSGALVVGDRFVDHQMQINHVYVAVKFMPLPASIVFRRWISFHQPIAENVQLVPDGYVELTSAQIVRPMFLEVDLGTEALKVWDGKIKTYLQLAISGKFAERFGQQQFRVLVIANSARRLKFLQKTVSKQTEKIFWLASIEDINREGLWSAIWLRPKGDQPLSLI